MKVIRDASIAGSCTSYKSAAWLQVLPCCLMGRHSVTWGTMIDLNFPYFIPLPLLQGFVYLKFAAVESAQAAHKVLHGRFYMGNQIIAEYQFVQIYNTYFQL
jgi:hypothetical protein